jgi:hypothetical protein
MEWWSGGVAAAKIQRIKTVRRVLKNVRGIA